MHFSIHAHAVQGFSLKQVRVCLRLEPLSFKLNGSRYGLRCGLPYVLPCGLPCGSVDGWDPELVIAGGTAPCTETAAWWLNKLCNDTPVKATPLPKKTLESSSNFSFIWPAVNCIMELLSRVVSLITLFTVDWPTVQILFAGIHTPRMFRKVPSLCLSPLVAGCPFSRTYSSHSSKD